MAGIIALLYGIVAYVLFLATFVYAIGFESMWLVPKNIDTNPSPIALAPVLINLVLLGLFAVQHTVMARRGFKAWWTRIVPKPVERSTYVLVATLLLALLMWQWRALGPTVWAVTAPVGTLALQALNVVGWGLVLAGTFMIDHFELFGLRQVWSHFRGKPFRFPPFTTRGLYKNVRHPIMLGFVIAFWATPVMTAGHLLFALATTGYILIGIRFEERDLVHYHGERYRAYRQAVPALIPGLGRAGDADRATSPGEAGG